jgi:hypothetical protein
MNTNTDDLVRSIEENNAGRRAAPRREPTPQDPTPNWRTHGEFPDDRRHWLMCPSSERYTCAKLTAKRHPCRCGVNHDAAVYEDGTMFCERTDSHLVANAETPDLQAMRLDFEERFIQLVRATELN